jgi:SARP family transcriptional regulator, regulator of embCAB operon
MRIQLCGDLRLESEDGTVSAKGFPGRQGRIAFVYLATNRRAVTRDELADALWAGALPRSWEHDLAAIISKLRAVLGRVGLKEVLRGSARTYELALPKGSTDIEQAATSVDAAERALRAKKVEESLELARDALEVLRSPFLPGEDGEWIERCRADLRLILVRALGVAADALEITGDVDRAIAHAVEAVALEPYRETGYVRLMKVQLAAGTRAEAVRTYERCRSLLAEELGVDPSPETENVYLEALRAQQATIKPDGKSISIVVVDDHPMWRETLRQTLEQAKVGKVVGEAADGVEALEVVADAKPDLVIMDMELPRLDGVKTTKRILDTRPDLKVLVLSASSEEALVTRAVKAGARGYLLKTAVGDEVADAVRRIAAGELVLPAQVADIVLAELRGTRKKRASDRASR